ncbi:unnamed protein product [Caenorhabditis angaria]|uniref:Uncharacterized protein n=1 Tax=Caenorhabditis angaria TaxID=860376 RepID=A0A9P1MVE2_9PELO|nr:unnamed protein product [Caenorhabditis angaria]
MRQNSIVITDLYTCEELVNLLRRFGDSCMVNNSNEQIEKVLSGLFNEIGFKKTPKSIEIKKLRKIQKQ